MGLRQENSLENHRLELSWSRKFLNFAGYKERRFSVFDLTSNPWYIQIVYRNYAYHVPDN